MKVLVTGSSGRVGRTVVDTLLKRGANVIGFDVQPSPIEHEKFRSVAGNFSETDALAEACARLDAVLHLGAFMSWNKEDQPKIFEANVTGTQNVLEAAAAGGAKKFVFASSGEVYPDRNPQYLPIDENHPTRPTSPYGLSKLMAEEAVRFYDRAHGLPSVILRFSHTQDAAELLDPDSFFSGSRFYLHRKIRQQREFGNPALADLLASHDDGENKLVISCNEDGRAHRMGICDTRDTAAGVICALDSDAAVGEAINLTPPTATSFDDAINDLQSATGLPHVRINIPGPDLNYEAAGEKAKGLLGYQAQWTFGRMVADAVEQRKS